MMDKSGETIVPLASTWVLLSIFYGGGERGAGLRDILSAGDYLNHAVLAYDELNSALGWLRSAGCVETRNGCWFPTAMAWDAYRPIDAASRSTSKQWNALDGFLQTLAGQTPLEPIVSLNDYRAAVKQYLG